MRALVVAFLVVCSSARADTFPDRTERVITLGRVWAQAKFFHPTIQTKDIDWDKALVDAIPKVEAAKTQAELNAAVQGMLAVIGDPVTRVVDSTPADVKPPTDWLTTNGDVVEVKIAAFSAGTFDYPGMLEKAEKVRDAAAKAAVLIIDLREPGKNTWAVGAAVEAFEGVLPAIDAWPLVRSIEHRGWRTQHGTTSGSYFSTFITPAAKPPKPAPKAGPKHVVFVADATATLPIHALALQAAGRATIVARGALRDEAVVDVTTVQLGGGAHAQIRISELVAGAPTADVTLATGDLMAKARAVAKSPPRKRVVAKARELPPLLVRDDNDYASTPYPSRELRMLAGIRTWAVIDRFLPYRYLIADWDGVLREMLPRLEAAPDRDGYVRVLREMTTRIGDGHVGLFPGAPDPTAKKRGIAPFEPRLVENQLVILRAADPAAMAKLGLAVGDVIETIDGKAAAAVIEERRATTTGSTADARTQRTASAVLTGDDGTKVVLGVRSGGGKRRDVEVTRSGAYFAALYEPPPGPHWKKLDGNIGYVDLTALTVPEVPAVMKDLESTKAIVFDMRGYPNGTAWALAPRLNTRGAKYGAQFLAPHVFAQADEGDTGDPRTRFLQTLPALESGATIYRGKVVVLIDDRAISQAEHTCLFFKEAAGATFVGSPTAGANGDVTVMRVPGGWRMSFTGQEVRHVDGTQLQQVGITPTVLVRPTIAGIRAGRDEVLQRAIAVVNDAKAR